MGTAIPRLGAPVLPESRLTPMRKIIIALVTLTCVITGGWMIIRRQAGTTAGQKPQTSVTVAGQPGDLGPGPGGSTNKVSKPASASAAPGASSGPSGSQSGPSAAVSEGPTGTAPAGPVGMPQDPGFKPRPGASSAPPLPDSEQATDQQLRIALDETLAGQTRPTARIEAQATAAVWKHLGPDIKASHLWTNIKLRATGALCEGAHPDPTDPVLLTVISVWSGQTTNHRTEIHRSETRVTRAENGAWNIVEDH